MSRSKRSDAKREIKANLPVEIRDLLGHKADVAGVSAKSYLERLTLASLENDRVIDALSPYCRRTYCHGNRAVLGRVIAPSLDALMPEGTNWQRVSGRFHERTEYLWIGEVAFALAAKSLSQTVTILVAEGLRLDVPVTFDAGDAGNDVAVSS